MSSTGRPWHGVAAGRAATVLLLLMGLLFTERHGCATEPQFSPKNYRYYFPDSQYHLAKSDDRLKAGEKRDQCCVQRDARGFNIAFIEFDQRGDFWTRSQLAIARAQLMDRTRGKKPLLIEYVHGWHHNAQEDEQRDVAGFRKFLAYLANSSFIREQGYSVFGVYLGWRGEKYRSGKDLLGRALWLPSQLSFYSVKQTGADVGAMPMISEALFWMVHDARAVSSAAHTVLIGHSFGAMVLENSIAQAIAAGAAVAPSEGNSSTAPADLVLLLNAATDSLRAKGLTEMLDRMGKSGDRRFVDRDRPLVVSVTSTGDWATGFFFPLGTGTANLTQSFREYATIGQHKPLPPGTSQRQFITTTPGHNRILRSHIVTVDEARIAPSSRTIANASPCQMIFDRNLAEPLPRTGDPDDRAWPFRSIAKNGGECRSAIRVDPSAYLHTAYWVVEAPKQIIHDHGDIFNEQALCLYASLFRIAQPDRNQPSGPRKLQMYAPSHPTAPSGEAPVNVAPGR